MREEEGELEGEVERDGLFERWSLEEDSSEDFSSDTKDVVSGEDAGGLGGCEACFVCEQRRREGNRMR